MTHRPVRTPTVLQMEATECGAAALGIILEYHGRYVPLEVLRDDCGVSRNGSNAFDLTEAAIHHGLDVTAIRTGARELRALEPPFVVFWQMNHFLVVEGFGRQKVYLNDPAGGRRSMSLIEFERAYSGVALLFTPGVRFRREGQRQSVISRLARRLATSQGALLFVVLAGLVLVVPDLARAALQRVFIDEILLEGRVSWLRPLLVAMAATALLRLAARALEHVYLTRLELRLALAESLDFVWHVLRLPISFFQRRLTGEIVSRAESAARVAGLISGELATTAVSLLTLGVYIAVILPYDPILATVGTGIGSLNLLALKCMARWRIERNRTIEQLRGRLLAGAMWAIQMIESVKAGGAEPDLFVRYSGDQARMTSALQALGRVNTLLGTLPSLLASLTAIAVLGLGGRQVMEGSLSIGVLVAVQALFAEFHQPFRDLARLGADVQKLRADLDRIDDVRSRPIDERAPVQIRSTAAVRDVAPGTAQPVPARRLSGQIEFRQVTFGYNRAAHEPLIADFSLCARPGQRIALVGASGSGKSTIGRLAAGLYRPWTGEVLYDGLTLGEVPRAVFVGSVALVDQEAGLFQGVVRENLTMWDDLVPPERSHPGGRRCGRAPRPAQAPRRL